VNSTTHSPVAGTAARELFMVGNAHLDPVWLWHWTEGYQEARATLTSAVTLIEENPDYLFTLDQVVVLAWIEESDPALFERVTRCIRDGRLEIVGGWWIEPDCNLPNGEAFVRQGLLAQRFLLDRFGITATVGCNVDPFGHHVMLPQILRGQGMDSYCFLRPGPHELRLPSTAFWWESPDGSRVLAYRIPHEYCGPSGDVGYHVEKSVNQLSPDVGDAMVFYGVGNHGGGPTRDNLGSIGALDRAGQFGRLTLSTPGRYFQHVRESGVELPVWTGDLQMHSPGCYSANSPGKSLNRRSEQALLAAERFAVVARHAVGTPYPAAELTHAWKQLLFNQFHDILPGSAIEAGLVEAAEQLGEVLSIAGRAVNRSLQTIARDVEVPFEENSQPLLVFNPHPWTLETDIEIETVIQGVDAHVVAADGGVVGSQRIQPAATLDVWAQPRSRRRLVVAVTVPPLGHRLYRLREGTAPTTPIGGVEATPTSLANELVRVEVDPITGWLTSLVDRRTGIDLLAGAPGAHTVVSEDTSDTWGHRIVSYVGPGEPFRPTSLRLIEDGPVRATIRVESRFGGSRLAEEFTLVSGTPAVRVRVTLDWHERLRLFKLRIPTAIENPTATYEVPFGHLVRPVDSTERPGQAWVDLSGTVGGRPVGLAVVNDAKYAYDATGADLGITAARSPVYAWHNPKHLDPDEIYSYQDQGRQTFTYLLLPHHGDWRAAGVVRRTAELLMPARVMFEHAHPGALPAEMTNAETASPRIQLTAVKASEDDPAQVILRAVEIAGESGPATIDVPLLGRAVTAEFGPYQIRTFLLGSDPDVPAVETDLLEFPAESP
jgi:alpha-mannosidase